MCLSYGFVQFINELVHVLSSRVIFTESESVFCHVTYVLSSRYNLEPFFSLQSVWCSSVKNKCVSTVLFLWVVFRYWGMMFYISKTSLFRSVVSTVLALRTSLLSWKSVSDKMSFPRLSLIYCFNSYLLFCTTVS